jgi:hypothetical protein
MKVSLKDYRGIVLFVALVVFGISAFMAFYQGGDSLPGDASIRSRLARDLFSRNYEDVVDSRGYHLLINSAAVAPAPTLFTLPFVRFEQEQGQSFLLLGAFLAVGLVFYLSSLFRFVGLPGALGLLVSILLLFLPFSPFRPWMSPYFLGVLLIVSAFCLHMTAWLKAPHLGSLAFAANWVGWGGLWDIRLLLLALPLLGIVVGRALKPLEVAAEGTWVHASENAWHTVPASAWRRLEGWLQISLLPVVLPVGIWVLFNWLIFGDPMRMFRHLPEGYIGTLSMLFVWLFLAGFLFLLFARFWSKSYMLVFVVYVALLTLSLSTPGRFERTALSKEISSPGQAEVSLEDLQALDRFLLENTGGRLLIVVGRPGYALMDILSNRGSLVHYLDVDISQIEERTPGRDVYIILSAAQKRALRNRIGLQEWDKRFMHEANFGHWHVFRFLKPWVPGQ